MKPEHVNPYQKMVDKIACPEDLVKQVQRKFPNHLPNSVVTPEKLGLLIGQQDVISYMTGIINQINR